MNGKDITIEELLDKAIKGEKLDEQEWKQVVYDYAMYNKIDMQEGVERRWHRDCTIIFPYKDKFYGITYGRGLTEYQEDSFMDCYINEVRQVIKTIEDWEFV